MHALQAAYSIAHFCKAIWAKVSSEKTSDSDYCNVLPGKRDTGVERRLIIQRQPIQRFQVSETEAHWATANIKIQQKQWIRYAEKKSKYPEILHAETTSDPSPKYIIKKVNLSHRTIEVSTFKFK